MAEEELRTHLGMKSLEPFDMAIGRMCRRWAHLEGAITVLFLKIAGWDYRLPMTYPMVSFLDFRDQMSVIKVGVLARGDRNDIVELVFESLNYIDNELRSSRNRLVHDVRTTADDGVGARHFRGAYSYERRSPSGHLALIEPRMAYYSLEEVEEITKDIEEETTFIFRLSSWFALPHSEPLGPLLEPPPRRHRLGQQGKQSQKDKGGAKPPRQPKPSSASRRKRALKDSLP